MAVIDVHNNNFQAGASVIQNLNEAPQNVDYDRIESELDEIQNRQNPDSTEYKFVDALRNGAKQKNWLAIKSVIVDYTGKLAQNVLVSLLGKCLSAYLTIKQ